MPDRLREGVITPASVMVSTFSTQHSDSSLTIVQYVSRVDGATAALRAALGTGKSKFADAARTLLDHAGALTLGPGVTFTTDAHRMAGGIGASPAAWRSSLQRLQALDHLLHSARVAPADPSALPRLQAILASSRFHSSQDWGQRFGAWLNDLLNSAFSDAPHPGGLFNLSTIPFAALFLAAIAGIVYLLAHGALRRSVHTMVASDDDAPSTVPAARQRLSAARAAGDYTSGLRYLFLAVLLDLQERDYLTLKPGATNLEYVRQVHTDAHVFERFGPLLEELTDAFDRAWYGHLPVDLAEFERCEKIANAIIARARDAVAA